VARIARIVLQGLIRFGRVPMSEDNERGIGEYLTVGAAAKFLGVSRSTLRNWDRAGKLKAVRHPINGYRLYRRGTLNKLLKSIIGKEGSIAGNTD
jgi:excisionase family DNA binding protein